LLTLLMVVICSLILIFEVLITACLWICKIKTGCDLLSNSYLWSIDNSYCWLESENHRVVICSLILIFEVLITAGSEVQGIELGCDLLSNSYLWSIDNSFTKSLFNCCFVVICSLILIFEVLITAWRQRELMYTLLWFAL